MKKNRHTRKVKIQYNVKEHDVVTKVRNENREVTQTEKANNIFPQKKEGDRKVIKTQ